MCPWKWQHEVVCLCILIFPELPVAVLVTGRGQGGSQQNQTGMSSVGVGVGCVHVQRRETNRRLTEVLLQKPQAAQTVGWQWFPFLGYRFFSLAPPPYPADGVFCWGHVWAHWVPLCVTVMGLGSLGRGGGCLVMELFEKKTFSVVSRTPSPHVPPCPVGPTELQTGSLVHVSGVGLSW